MTDGQDNDPYVHWFQSEQHRDLHWPVHRFRRSTLDELCSDPFPLSLLLPHRSFWSHRSRQLSRGSALLGRDKKTGQEPLRFGLYQIILHLVLIWRIPGWVRTGPGFSIQSLQAVAHPHALVNRFGYEGLTGRFIRCESAWWSAGHPDALLTLSRWHCGQSTLAGLHSFTWHWDVFMGWKTASFKGSVELIEVLPGSMQDCIMPISDCLPCQYLLVLIDYWFVVQLLFVGQWQRHPWIVRWSISSCFCSSMFSENLRDIAE